MGDKKIYDVLKPENWNDRQGNRKSRFYQVGTGFETESGGISLTIPEGIALTGRIVITPRKERESGEADQLAKEQEEPNDWPQYS